MDAFSEILSAVKLNGALYFNAEFSAPWGVNTPPSRQLAPLLAPGAPHLVIYHLVIDGSAFAHMEGRSVALHPGDVVVLPHGDPHVMTSEIGLAEWRESLAVERKVQARDFTMLEAGGGGERTRLVCGFMSCDPQLSRPILTGLPPIFKVNLRADRSGQWLESSILHLVEEASSGTVGSDAMLAKLSEALFVDTLRRYLAALPERETG